MLRRQAIVLFPQAVATPAPGAEFSLAPRGQGGILVQSLTFTLATSAVVANRIPTLVLSDGNAPTWRTQPAAAVAAGVTTVYQGFDGAIPNVGGGGLVTLGWPNQGVWIPQGWTLASVTAGIDPVGDQYSAITAYVQEFSSGPEFYALPVELLHTEPLN